jgi:DnaK suppressor protein
MESDKLEYYQRLLNEQLEALLSEAARSVNDMSGRGESFADPVDSATLESDRNFLLRIRDRERKLIKKIREALERIEKGSYGICEECGEEISEQRLMTRPIAALCIECKASQEEAERRLGQRTSVEPAFRF